MKTRMARLLLLSIVGIVLFVGVPAKIARACIPTQGPATDTARPTTADYVKAASIVVHGTVIQTIKYSNNWATAIIKVEKYYKGRGPALIRVPEYGYDSWCATNIGTGEVGIFYIDWGPYHGYSAHGRSPYIRSQGAKEPITPDTIKVIIATTGQQPVAPDPVSILTVLDVLYLNNIEPVDLRNGIARFVVPFASGVVVYLLRIHNP